MTKRQRHDALNSTSLKSQVVEKLRNAILSGNYVPGGKLNEDQLARKFKTSRVPIREALIHLKEAGLVMDHDRRGLCALALDHDELRQIDALRLILEVEAIKLARKNMTPDLALRLKNIVRRMGNRSGPLFHFHILDLEFHSAIWSASGNPYLTNALTPLVLRSFAHKALQDRVRTPAPNFRDQMRSWHVARHSDLLDLLTCKSDSPPEDAILFHMQAEFEATDHLAP